MLRAILISLTLLLAASTTSHAYGIADSFEYNKAPHSVKSRGLHRPIPQKHVRGVPSYTSRNRLAVPSVRDGRPRAWCGWYMRQIKGGGPSFNVARNWINYGQPTAPQLGAVVVWPHHVGYIVGRTAQGNWIVRPGNYGNRVADVPLNKMPRNVIAYRI